ncbi:MAG: hypothetical protein LBU70_10030, partial [Chitinispirillales bacterium]|nr:hypothetical protein [Chitinispirillales bacterium]
FCSLFFFVYMLLFFCFYLFFLLGEGWGGGGGGGSFVKCENGVFGALEAVFEVKMAVAANV